MDGESIDGGVYTDMADWAHGLPGWLGAVVRVWSDYGLVVFALLMVAAWVSARRGDGRAMARTLCSPVIVVLAYLVNEAVKGAVEERRPCLSMPQTRTLEACPGPTDWAFPSNHSVIAAAAAVALIVAVRRCRGGAAIGWVAVVAALAMGVSRVLIGAHYPHDVVAGWLLGLAVGWPLAIAAGLLWPVVDAMRRTWLAVLLGPGAGLFGGPSGVQQDWLRGTRR